MTVVDIVADLSCETTAATVRGVHTEAGDIDTSAVVIAGGAWSSELADDFRVALPVGPLKGQIIHLQLPAADSSGWSIVQPVLGFYLVPWPDGRVACGGTMEAEARFDHRVTAGGVDQLLRECLRTAPGLSDGGSQHTACTVLQSDDCRMLCSLLGLRSK